MEKEALLHLAKSLNALTNIPVLIDNEKTGETVAVFNSAGEFSNDEAINNQLTTKYKNIVQMSDGQRIGYYISDDLLGIGKVRDIKSELCLVLGGCKLADVNRNAANNMLSHAKNTMEVPQTPSNEKFFSYMQRFPRVTPLYFLWLLSMINTAINHEAADLDSFISLNPFFNNIDKDVDGIFIRTREFSGDEENGTEKIKSERMLISYVRSGDLNAVNRYWHNNSSEYKYASSIFVRDTLRQTKNNFITLVSLISRAVAEEGISENIACKLADSYVVRAEGCLSVEEFDNLIPSMLNDFTSKVKELKESNMDDNYIVKRAIAYIKDHITEKILLSDISSALKISNGYLSSLFKKSTEMPINDFINKQKILESRNLLDNTTMTLSEITNHFSFSSQSYYQNLFKKFMGITPTEYRRKNKIKK